MQWGDIVEGIRAFAPRFVKELDYRFESDEIVTNKQLFNELISMEFEGSLKDKLAWISDVMSVANLEFPKDKVREYVSGIEQYM